MRRIAYSPEVRVYIQPNEKDKDGKLMPPIDISADIIEGSIERRSNDISTARFVVQGRKLGKENETDPTSSILLANTIRPMDKIIVYLKKTKPILVFSGYIDLVPLVQFVPEPVVIEASCSLKRLQYTYWDPTLPNVMQAFIQMGMIVQKNESGFNVFQPPGQDSTSTGQIEDQGFPKLLSFLLIDVGGWDPETVYIEPLPQEWLDSVEPMFRSFVQEDQTWESAKAFLDAWLGASGTTDGGGDDGGTGGGDGDTATITAGDIADKIDAFIKRIYPNTTVEVDGQDFVTAGKKHNIDPRFLVAMARWETGIGTNKASQAGSENDMFGLEDGRKFPTLAAGIIAIAEALRKSGPGKYAFPLNKYPRLTAKQGVAGWNKGDINSSASYEAGFVEDYKSMGGNPDKVFSITAQGIGETIDNPNRNSATDTGTNDQTKIAIYLEAVGDGEKHSNKLNGYQKLDFLARNYTSENSKNRMSKNRDLIGRINTNIAALNLLFKNKFGFDPIKVNIVNHSNVKRSWKGALYLAIDHTESGRDEDVCYYVTPQGSTPDLTNPTLGYGNDGDYGSDWKNPVRKTIKNKKSLINSSNAFVKFVGDAREKTQSKENGNGLSLVRGSEEFSTKNAAKNSWRGAIPGFFYTQADACAYLQLPNKHSGSTDETKDWAWQIAFGIFNFYLQTKASETIKTGTDGDPSNDASNKLPYVEPTYPLEPRSQFGHTVNDALHRIYGILQARWPGIEASSTVRNRGNSSQHEVGDALDLQFTYASNGNPSELKKPDANPKLSKVAKWMIDVGIAKLVDQAIFNNSTNTRGGSDMYYNDGKKVDGVGFYDANGRTGTFDHQNHIHIGISSSRSDAVLAALDGLSDGGVSDSGGTNGGDSDESQSYQDAINFNKAAFNVAYQFPGSLVDSILLRGKRALQNDVPLLDSVRDIAIGSMRNFASLPNGDFIAWYPDYFNIAGRSPWLRISQVEIKKCTIDFSDKFLATHVYIMGNPYGIGNLPAAQSEWYNKLQGAGVITIEQEGILESFLPKKKDKTGTRQTTEEGTDIQHQTEHYALPFLEKYGARPYTESNLTIRHPLVEFFYAYNTFMTKWAEQFISRAEFTFMPELFPGMIIEIPNYREDLKSFSFYVQEVTHTFSYAGGFSTSAILIAPGIVNQVKGDSLGMVPVRAPSGNRPATTYTIDKIEPTSGRKKSYKEWLNGRKSTDKLAAQWKKLNNIK